MLKGVVEAIVVCISDYVKLPFFTFPKLWSLFAVNTTIKHNICLRGSALYFIFLFPRINSI